MRTDTSSAGLLPNKFLVLASCSTILPHNRNIKEGKVTKTRIFIDVFAKSTPKQDFTLLHKIEIGL